MSEAGDSARADPGQPDVDLGVIARASFTMGLDRHGSGHSTLHSVAIPRLRRNRGLYRSGIKRALDLLLTFLVLPPVVLVILLLALAIAVDGGRPFYSQTRLGRGKRSFRLWKLRSMVPDADARLQAHLDGDPVARAEWETTQKLKRDPRITRIGRILRRTSLDELPQLWNVLKGDMSLVGPRPMMPTQRSLYPGWAYFVMRPGITGLWQVSERNDTSFAKRASFDQEYHHRLSFTLDAKVLVATVRVVLRATGH